MVQSTPELLKRPSPVQLIEQVTHLASIAIERERAEGVLRELHDHFSQTLGVETIKIDQLRANEGITPDVGPSEDHVRPPRDRGDSRSPMSP